MCIRDRGLIALDDDVISKSIGTAEVVFSSGIVDRRIRICLLYTSEWYRQLFERLDNSKFRSSFHLKQKDIDYINEKGLDTIRQHAADFIEMCIRDRYKAYLDYFRIVY